MKFWILKNKLGLYLSRAEYIHVCLYIDLIAFYSTQKNSNKRNYYLNLKIVNLTWPIPQLSIEKKLNAFNIYVSGSQTYRYTLWENCKRELENISHIKLISYTLYICCKSLKQCFLSEQQLCKVQFSSWTKINCTLSTLCLF